MDWHLIQTDIPYKTVSDAERLNLHAVSAVALF